MNRKKIKSPELTPESAKSATKNSSFSGRVPNSAALLALFQTKAVTEQIDRTPAKSGFVP
jgi:hypothetical protein